jgi:maltoporin
MRQQIPVVTLLNAKATTGVSVAQNVEGFAHVVFSLATDGGGTADLTVKFQGAVDNTAPDFSAAQTAGNMWDYIEVVDLQNGNPIDGDTGITVSGADDYRLLEMNTNHLKWVSVRVTARAAGSVTVKAKLAEE